MSGAVDFTLTIATCKTVDEINAWAAAARHNARFVYAQGVYAPNRAPGFVYVRTLVDGGLVRFLPQHRDAATRITQWSVARTDMAWPVGGGRAQAKVSEARSAALCADGLTKDGLTIAEVTLLDLCKRCEARRENLPENRHIAKMIGHRSPADASNRLRKLIRLNFIRIDYGKVSTERRVTVLR